MQCSKQCNVRCSAPGGMLHHIPAPSHGCHLAPLCFNDDDDNDDKDDDDDDNDNGDDENYLFWWVLLL